MSTDQQITWDDFFKLLDDDARNEVEAMTLHAANCRCMRCDLYIKSVYAAFNAGRLYQGTQGYDGKDLKRTNDGNA